MVNFKMLSPLFWGFCISTSFAMDAENLYVNTPKQARKETIKYAELALEANENALSHQQNGEKFTEYTEIDESKTEALRKLIVFVKQKEDEESEYIKCDSPLCQEFPRNTPVESSYKLKEGLLYANNDQPALTAMLQIEGGYLSMNAVKRAQSTLERTLPPTPASVTVPLRVEDHEEKKDCSLSSFLKRNRCKVIGVAVGGWATTIGGILLWFFLG